MADSLDIIQLARSNDAFRREVATGGHSQVVVMTIPPGTVHQTKAEADAAEHH